MCLGHIIRPHADDTHVAIMRDHTKLISLGRSAPALSKSQIQIYSPAGEGMLVFSVDIQTVLVCGLANDGICSGTRAKSFDSGGRLTRNWLY